MPISSGRTPIRTLKTFRCTIRWTMTRPSTFAGGSPPTLSAAPFPVRFEDRYYALRSGMQRWVTSPSLEIADDLLWTRLGVRQRWQTKRGAPGQERIVDWIALDVEGVVFPDDERDNYGQPFGLVNYDFRWHVGDRLTLLSDGFADFFDQGLQTYMVGTQITRPERGNLFLGYRWIEGPVSSQLMQGSVAYRMTEKWILAAGAIVDLTDTGNIGQSVDLTRIGESMLVRVGFNVDSSRDNFGVNFAIEPRFLAAEPAGAGGGRPIPTAGRLRAGMKMSEPFHRRPRSWGEKFAGASAAPSWASAAKTVLWCISFLPSPSPPWLSGCRSARSKRACCCCASFWSWRPKCSTVPWRRSPEPSTRATIRTWPTGWTSPVRPCSRAHWRCTRRPRHSRTASVAGAQLTTFGY